MFCLYNLHLPASPESSPPLMPITPTLHHPGNLSDATADLNWSTPLSLDMPGCDSSPTDFAFAAPTIDSPFDKTPSYSTPNTYSNFNIPGYGYSSASPFSSTSGSTTGSSFSSADALPAISRDFVRPSPTQTRRPATAGAALQSRSPFVGFMAEGDRFQRQNRSSTVSADGKIPETIDEGEGVFANPNPFASSSEDDKQAQAHVDSHFNPSHRRASEPQFGEAHWSSFTSPVNPYLNAGQMNFSMNPHMQQLQRSMPEPARPQTHHGLPSSSSMVSLPSARTIVNQIDGFAAPPNVDAKPEDKTMQPSTLMPFRDTMSMGTQRAYSIDSSKTTRPSQHNRSAKSETDSDITFFPLGGPAPKKRPRRRFDEIERLYACGWNGCEKAYGTLNHLNAHVAMQKHGEKRLPSRQSLTYLSSYTDSAQNSKTCARHGGRRSSNRRPQRRMANSQRHGHNAHPSARRPTQTSTGVRAP